jgi:NADP-dependent 3-hydroxy acid dehydrogenase YdfG
MEDKVVLITGASSGIGACAAEHFAKIGYKKIAIVARREEELNKVAKKCRENGAKDVLVTTMDLSTVEGAITAVEQTMKHFQSQFCPLNTFAT